MKQKKLLFPHLRRRFEQWHVSPKVFLFYLFLRLLVIIAGVLALLRGDYESAFLCLLTLLLFLMPLLLERALAIDLPSALEVIILLFIFAAEILGELGCYYLTFPHWDLMLHTVNGFLFAAAGFSLTDILCRNSRIKFEMAPIYAALVAFCFSMTIGVFWEFFEYGMDRAFSLDMQKDTVITGFSSVTLDPTQSNHPVRIEGIESVTVNGQELGLNGYLELGLYDTMEDLFVNFIGAAVFSVIGYYYIKNKGQGRFARQFIPTLRKPKKE